MATSELAVEMLRFGLMPLNLKYGKIDIEVLNNQLGFLLLIAAPNCYPVAQ